MNLTEQTPPFLVALWLHATFVSISTAAQYGWFWLAMRSRSFSNDAYGFLVPLACLMNHPAVGESANVELEYDREQGAFVMTAVRHIKQGEELTYSYGASLCRERALLVYGFELDGMPTCPGF